MKKYKTIYIDPPWPEHGAGKIKRGADKHYQLMSIKDIMALPVLEHVDVNAHLYIWVTNNYLPIALKCIEHWEFEYKTIITWMKNSIGIGQYFRGITEHCLFATRGKLPFKKNNIGRRLQGATGFYSKKREHSRKPIEMRKMIEKVSYPPFIEFFAREGNPEWSQWGNEVDKFDNKKGIFF
jgi:N6-adenosine-specific RNA methylase IME4